MDERSSLFFVDQGEDKDPVYLKIFVKLFDSKESKLKLHTPEGDIINTGLIVDYYVPKRNDVEMMLVSPQNSPLAPNCKKEDQLFIFNETTGGKFQNTMAIKVLFEEAVLYQAYEIIGGNVFKIVICESRFLGIEGTNKWTVYMPKRITDRLTLIQRGLLGLLK